MYNNIPIIVTPHLNVLIMRKLILFLAVLFPSMLAFAQVKDAKFKSVNEAEFAKIVADKSVQIVDVRTAEEFASGHLENALNYDVKGADFEKNIASLSKDKTVAVYCRSGARSKVAAQKLAEKGYNVVELDGGIMAWKGKKVK